MRVDYFLMFLASTITLYSCDKSQDKNVASTAASSLDKGTGDLPIYKELTNIASNNYCTKDKSCKIVGVGAAPCGGYSGYLVYSSESTDETRLLEKVAESVDLAKAYNAKHAPVGHCSILSIPSSDEVACLDNICRVVKDN